MSYEQLRHHAQLLASGPLSCVSADDEELVALCLARGPAFVVAVLHCACCVVQSSCSGGTALESDAAHPARDALRDLAKESGEGMQLVGGS